MKSGGCCPRPKFICKRWTLVTCWEGIAEPKHTMPVSSSVMGLNGEQQQQEAKPKRPSTFLPANPTLKDELMKWEQDFQNLNLGEGKFPKSSSSHRKVVQMVDPCFEERMQELNRKSQIFAYHPDLKLLPPGLLCPLSPEPHAIEIVQNAESLEYYSRLFLVPKPQQKWRPVIDLSRPNQFLRIEKFQNGDPRINKDILKYREWVTSIDQQMPIYMLIHPRSRKVSEICPQISSLSLHLSSIQASSNSSSVQLGPVNRHKDTPNILTIG